MNLEPASKLVAAAAVAATNKKSEKFHNTRVDRTPDLWRSSLGW
jgi:hypothetical protein